MPNVRSINQNKYGISKHKFLQVYHFCMQYNEWKDELQYKADTVKSIEITGMPKGSGGENATEKLAIRRAELMKKCELIESTCREADPDIWRWLFKAVTNDGVSYTYLKECMNIPCGKDMYYDRRRKFYWLMSRKI